MRRPSPSLVISILALVVASSGTAYAATGGTFILGTSNTADAPTSLTNPNGTALRLTAKADTPPLAVNSQKLVANLNAAKLAGRTWGQLATTVSNSTATVFPILHTANDPNSYSPWGGTSALDPALTAYVTKREDATCLLARWGATSYISGNPGTVDFYLRITNQPGTPSLSSGFESSFYVNTPSQHQMWGDENSTQYSTIPKGDYLFSLMVKPHTAGTNVLTDGNDRGYVTVEEVHDC